MTPTKKTTDKDDKKPAAKKAPAAKKVVAKAAPKKKAEAPPAQASDTPKAEKAEETKREGAYIYALGRRKRAIAQTRMFSGGTGTITINDQPYNEYFAVYEYQEALLAPLKAVGQEGVVDIQIQTVGGGLRGQAEAARLGISRALIEANPLHRKTLKKMGFLTRDPREKERKKYGLRKARRAPQWAKR